MSSSTPSTIEVDELAARENNYGFHISNEDISEVNNSNHDGKEDKFVFMKRMLNYIKISLIQLTVEPIIFLVYLGWIFGNTIQSPGMYRRICEMYYSDDPYVNCYHIDDSKIENNVQKHSAEWSLYNSLAYLIPAIIADTILGAFGDKYGRQMNILLGIAGIAISEYSYSLALSYDVAAPYWITTVVGIFTGFTGYIAMVPVSCNAYLADITDDPELLTIRSGIFSVAQSVASVFGGVVAALVNGISIPLAVDIEILMYIFAFIYTFWRIPQKPNIHELERRSRVSTLTSNTSNIYDVKTFFVELWHLLKIGFRTYIRRRIGHRRAFMFITATALMITYTTSVETRMSQVINSFVFRRTGDDGLNWDSSDLGYWNAVGFLILIIGTLLGLFIFKKILHLRETTIIIIAIISSSIRTAIIAFAKEDWHMYVANVTGLFAGLVQPAVVSFIVQIVPNEEVGRAFSLFGIGGDLSFIITNVVYSNIYRLTIDWFPGFLFLFITFIQAITCLAMVWVHIQAVREGVFKDNDEPPPRDIQRAISEIGSEGGKREAPLQLKPKRKKGKQPLSIYEHAMERGRMKNLQPIWSSHENVSSIRDHAGSFY